MTHVPNKCLRRHTDAEFTIREQLSEVIFQNPNLREVQQITVDGCVFKEDDGKRCDHLVSVDETQISVLVELKGSDIEAAVEQLAETQQRLAEHLNRRIFWVVSYSGSPRHTTSIAYMQLQARLHNRATLLVEESSYTHAL